MMYGDGADLELKKYTPYISLMGELWAFYSEYFGGKWPCYNGIRLVISAVIHCSQTAGQSDAVMLICSFDNSSILMTAMSEHDNLCW